MERRQQLKWAHLQNQTDAGALLPFEEPADKHPKYVCDAGQEWREHSQASVQEEKHMSMAWGT